MGVAASKVDRSLLEESKGWGGLARGCHSHPPGQENALPGEGGYRGSRIRDDRAETKWH